MLHPADTLLGRLARDQGWLTSAQLGAALDACGGDPPGPRLGRVLVQRGLLTPARVFELLAAHAERFAECDPHAAERAQSWHLAADALEHGRASTDQIDRALAEQLRREAAGEPWAPMSELLLGRDARTEVNFADTGGLQRDAQAETSRLPSASAPSAPDLTQRFGKYELVKEIGRGGMGAVYQAYHTGLQTHFALKVLLPGPGASTEDRARLLKEAQALARLHHPGIVAVHDVGEEDGRVFVAMEYVEGTTLDHWLADQGGNGVPAATALAMLREIAEAIVAAHAAGVLHRDLKPANVLRDGAGRLKVMDFGLAKLQDATPMGTTRTGSIMGTPPYMSPEHVDAGMKEVDAQSDVYQLGAILYELLTGRRPYEGSSTTEILLQIARADPPPPRRLNPAIDPAAETICLKAMAREKAQRYATPAALAEDARRFVAGEPILARPETSWMKAVRWTRRRKALSAALAAVVLALAAAGGMAWRTRSLEAEVLDAVRTTARTSVDGALLLRQAGGKMSDAKEKLLGPLEDAARRAIERAPALAEPNYHLGVMYRALMRFDDAYREQSRALEKEPDSAASRYERAVLASQRYGARLAELRERWLRAQRRSQLAGEQFMQLDVAASAKRGMPGEEELAGGDATAKDLAAAVLADLAHLERLGAGGRLECARGLALSYRGAEQRGEARARLNAALAAEPHLTEAYEALARVERADGKDAEAAAVFTRAIEFDKGYVPFRIARAEARRSLGLRQQARGEDPTPAWMEAVADYVAAIELDPAAETWEGRGLAHVTWGIWLDMNHQDPEPQYVLAAADFDRAIALDPDSFRRRLSRGALGIHRGILADRTGRDPRGFYTAAVADYDRALALDPTLLEAWLDRSEVRSSWGIYLTHFHQDADAQFAAAESDLAEAMKLAPQDALAWLRRGSVRMNWGVSRRGCGGDPETMWNDARKDFAHATEVDPTRMDAWWRQAGLLSQMSSLAEAKGKDPQPLFEEAAACLKKAVEIDPDSGAAYEEQGSLYANWASWLESRGRDGGARWTEAIAAHDRAVEHDARHAYAWIGRADALVSLGISQARHGGDPGPTWERALADYTKACELEPGSEAAWASRGSAHRWLAISAERKGEDGGAHFRQARADLDAAVKAAPRSARALVLRAQVAMDWAGAGQARREDPSERYASAEADFTAAARLDPRDAEALRGRGLLHGVRGRWAEAAADLEAAKQLDPHADPQWDEMLADAKRRAGQGAPEWAGCFREAGEKLHARNLDGALAYYARGLELYRAAADKLAPAERERFESANRQGVCGVHYNMACAHALAATAGGVEAAQAARDRDEAFAHLQEAVRLGWSDRGHLEGDPDLAALRGDGRWKGVVESLDKQGK